MYNQNSDLMKQEKFMLPTMIEGDFSAEELAEDADGLQMSFQRVKIPAGGTLQFEMPSDDPDNPDYEKTLVGVILHNHATCAYWPAGSEYDDDTTPLCSSVDGKVGIGTPGGACAACVMNRFGSAPDGSKGKACKNMRVLYLLRSGEYMPLQVNLPPTSIKPFKEFLNRAFMLRRRATYGSIVQIGLKRENNGTNDYSVATFKLLQDFQGKELAQIRAYANSFKEQIKLLLQQRAEMLFNIQFNTSREILTFNADIVSAFRECNCIAICSGCFKQSDCFIRSRNPKYFCSSLRNLQSAINRQLLTSFSLYRSSPKQILCI